MYSLFVTFYIEGNKFTGDLEVPQGDLLCATDARNITNHVLVEELGQVDLDLAKILFMHIKFRSLPAHMDEFELLLSGLKHTLLSL